MRKIVLTFAAILVATCSFAQNNFSWGVKAALNISSEYDTGTFSDGDMFVGVTAGFLAEFKVSDLFAVQPELVYSIQGSNNYVTTGEKTTGTKSFVYNYLNLPVMLKFYVYQDKLSIDVGPQVGYLLKATEKRTPKNMATQTIDMKDDEGYNRIENDFDVSAALGVSYKFAKSFDVSARYTMGFTKTLKDEYDPYHDMIVVANNKNNCFQIGLSARF